MRVANLSPRERAMRLIFVSVLFLVYCSSDRPAGADDKSDCLNRCAIDKRTSDMYCPPAGGYSDDDHKQCREKNAAAHSQCIKACTPEPPALPPAEPPPAAIEQPVTTQDEPVPAE